ncbi:enoyl-CoA hydratase [Aestuariicella hydrocarbonica]|uniref:Enoyl-CoA hydratase n=1 Tax=Pseudomaricurvus hydrocarbonicus TaxID=1470433 RepID=A0A9E5JU91_9GAMM|nr:enoyl-CoA hydratase-related protein [Aestuariicella hydrocarbonica]NHO66659.1 enoyl-CoA hydratase [Aestuariicella hydrocarbonica]
MTDNNSSISGVTNSGKRVDGPVVFSVDNHIAHIRFNRPDCLNALNVDTAKALLSIVNEIKDIPSVRVIVLSGEGRAFLAGGDLSYFQAAGENAGEAARTLIDPIHAAIAALSEAPQPVIASIHGAVAGAGMSLAMISDLVIAADNTIINSAYIRVANNPDCSGTWTLPRLVGIHKAMEILLLSNNINADEALRLGMVNWVVAVDKLQTETESLAQQLAASAPQALASIKRLVRKSLDSSLQSQLDDEGESFANNADTDDFKEALSAFFDKRSPTFKGC